MLLGALLLAHCSRPTIAAEPVPSEEQPAPAAKPPAAEPVTELPPNAPLADRVQAYLDEHKPKSLSKKIVIKKARRLLEIWINDALLATYKADLGGNPVPDKIKRGDSATPEGEFFVARKLPRSTFYKALLISYPDKPDAQRGLEAKLISQNQHDAIVKAIDGCREPPQGTRLGGALEIHGNGGSGEDWTLGCVGIADEAMLGVFNWAEVGCKRVKGKLVPRTLIVIEP